MRDEDILKNLVEYCREFPNLDTLNKISELSSLTGQKLKGRMSDPQLVVYEQAIIEWRNSNPTPREFKGIFRGGR